jgi:hypothetical protein
MLVVVVVVVVVVMVMVVVTKYEQCGVKKRGVG